jgi:hypothetical protein
MNKFPETPRVRLININKKNGTPWSLSKSIRFPSSESDHKSEVSSLRTSFESKSITMGFGKRWQPKAFTEEFSPNGSLYLLRGSLNSSLGPIFNKKPKRVDENGVPGPGSYDPIRQPSKNSPKVSLKSKYKDLTPVKCPSPISYSPKYTQVFKKQYKDVSFGFGDRNFLKNMETDSPGPNIYRLPSQFDKFDKTRQKNSRLFESRSSYSDCL